MLILIVVFLFLWWIYISEPYFILWLFCNFRCVEYTHSICLDSYISAPIFTLEFQSAGTEIILREQSRLRDNLVCPQSWCEIWYCTHLRENRILYSACFAYGNNISIIQARIGSCYITIEISYNPYMSEIGILSIAFQRSECIVFFLGSYEVSPIYGICLSLTEILKLNLRWSMANRWDECSC
jgi:hypothetical protein